MLTLKANEIKAIKNSFTSIIENVDGEELSTRIGFSKNEILSLKGNIESHGYSLTRENWILVSQVLNEVCYGYYIKDFKLVIGEDIEFVAKLLTAIQKDLE